LLAFCAAAALSAAACTSDREAARLAQALAAGRLVEPTPGLGMADAERARERLVPLLERHWGRAVGYKAALTSAAVQRRYGLAEPVRGSIFAMTLSLADGAEVPARFGAEAGLAVEPDLLVRVRDEGIDAAGRDRVAILRHLDQVIPFIELPARRLGAMTVVFSEDGREIARAPGSALLGHPLDVIPWLVGDLAKQGRRLRAGDFVSLGGFASSVPARPGRNYALRYEGLLDEPVTVGVRVR
jgi:2-keto-4-pentenoate hydratase